MVIVFLRNFRSVSGFGLDKQLIKIENSSELMYLNRSKSGLDDMQNLQLGHLAQGTMTRCAEPLDNIQKRQQEILARGQVRPQYKPVTVKGPKLG